MMGPKTKRFSVATGILSGVLFILTLCQTACLSSFGGNPAGERLERMKKSRQFQGEYFENNPFVPMIVPGTYGQMLRRQLFGSETRVPSKPVPVVIPNPEDFVSTSPQGLRAIWLGHATVLVEIDGIRILTDPVFSDKVSPFESIGPGRFFPVPIPLKNLPPIDAVVVSHDHYDHLDMETAKFLTSKGTKYFVPLGIGAHLETWGIPSEKIVELDWWDKGNIKNIEIICTPAVHYSGRGLFNRKSTLWSSWSVLGPKHRFFHSGDTGYSTHFKEIGKRLGPFQLTSVKIGAYDWTWEGIHMNPEYALQAHLDLNGKKFLPVHWGTFNLAIHSWDEPIQRAVKAAEENRIDIATPKPGEWVDANSKSSFEKWWEKIKD
ncbi:hypothetical protein EHQ27_00980 [Leptospira wolffii]|uniref:MBL fold metallo-hydrolase n=1 Tax=Leptospira wolffii TaxID=409998 RepID=UPI001082D11E|nr:MBL fold metallo-hydrolase [Leptospira wolffii]TGK59334.1 hypothetical protein EHQ32_11130 [Leptospira wolffii]TGK71283.1 hypothetical protein EHQ35_14215 [Leptospira wolffii]TGK77850.1 hypothetical protein EHQ27_00980 [Leptospira wolffii]TGL29440.1 hypothetical protein EHQ57_10940 [Leptospira wolffii]